MPKLLVLRFSRFATALIVGAKIVMKKVPFPAGFFFMPYGAGGFCLIPKGYEVSDFLLIGDDRATIENDRRVLFVAFLPK